MKFKVAAQERKNTGQPTWSSFRGTFLFRLLGTVLLSVVRVSAYTKEYTPEELAAMSPAKRAFYTDYVYTWGDDEVHDDGTAVLTIKDKDHAGGGWTSRQPWVHGVFSAMIKAPKTPSCGVVTAFYMTSEWNTSWPGDLHDELDFEILSDDNSGEYQLQTNYFVGGKGAKEERIRAWFDPTADFHEYKIQVNKEAVRWYIDGILVREITEADEGGLPKTSQFLVASLWDGAFWVPCTWGREQRVLDYKRAPFSAYFKNITMVSCYWRQMNTKERPECANPDNTYLWDFKPKKKDYNTMKYIQQHHIVYSYETWNETSGPRRPEAPEERTAEHMFDFMTDPESHGMGADHESPGIAADPEAQGTDAYQ